MKLMNLTVTYPFFPFKYKTKLKLSKDCAVFIYGINSNIGILLIGENSRLVPEWQTSPYQNNCQNVKVKKSAPTAWSANRP